MRHRKAAAMVEGMSNPTRDGATAVFAREYRCSFWQPAEDDCQPVATMADDIRRRLGLRPFIEFAKESGHPPGHTTWTLCEALAALANGHGVAVVADPAHNRERIRRLALDACDALRLDGSRMRFLSQDDVNRCALRGRREAVFHDHHIP